MYQIELIIGSDTKLAEPVLEHPDILDALTYLNIRLGFEEQTIREVADRYRINLEALLVIILTYCGQLLPEKTIKKEALSDLLGFLKNAHNDFKQNQIPELKNRIALFASEIPEKHGNVLISFFDGYIGELSDHFKYEDETVFPYIEAILNGRPTSGFAMHEFEKNHTDIEQKLYDLKNILIKYIPEASDSGCRKQILRNLFYFEQQLSYHTELENRVLAPSVKKVEKKGRRGKY